MLPGHECTAWRGGYIIFLKSKIPQLYAPFLAKMQSLPFIFWENSNLFVISRLRIILPIQSNFRGSLCLQQK